MTVKAISLHQPFPQLIVMGVKKWETRSWPCPPSIIGQHVAFASTKRKPTAGSWVGDWVPIIPPDRDGWVIRRYDPDEPSRDASIDLPLGCVVGSGTITASVEISKVRDDGSWTIKRQNDGVPIPGIVLDQIPYGDFSPGRYAWLIEDAAPTTERCPWCWGRGWTDHENGIHSVPCPVCKCAGFCDPIPVTGRQGFWNWEPRA